MRELRRCDTETFTLRRAHPASPTAQEPRVSSKTTDLPDLLLNRGPVFVLRSLGTNRGQPIRRRSRVNKQCMPRGAELSFEPAFLSVIGRPRDTGLLLMNEDPAFVLCSQGTNRGCPIPPRPRVNKQCMTSGRTTFRASPAPPVVDRHLSTDALRRWLPSKKSSVRPMFPGTNRGRRIRGGRRVNKLCMPRRRSYFFGSSIT